MFNQWRQRRIKAAQQKRDVADYVLRKAMGEARFNELTAEQRQPMQKALLKHFGKNIVKRVDYGND